MSVRTIAESFARCRAWLEPAMIEGWTEDEVLNELVLGRAQLWEGDRAAAVTRCFAPDQFHVWLAGGSLSGVLGLVAGGVAWARPMGFRRMTVRARRGWARVLADYGFETVGDGVLERAI